MNLVMSVIVIHLEHVLLILQDVLDNLTDKQRSENVRRLHEVKGPRGGLCALHGS